LWETSDPYSYRELGAIKSGRDSQGQAWQESWKETYSDYNAGGFRAADRNIHREASKWSRHADGQSWSEAWTEEYRGDGRAVCKLKLV